MTGQAAPPSAKARIVAAHRRAPAPGRGPLAERSWGRALRRAAMPFAGLQLQVGAVTLQWDRRVDAVATALPPQGMVVMLEDAAGRRGVLALDHGMIDALVEVQTTGQVDAQQGPRRPITRIDAALCRDFLDLVLSCNAAELAGVPDRDWPDRMTYGSELADRDRLGLLLPDQGYHIFSADLALGAAARAGQVVLVMPVDRALITAAPPLASAPDGPWRKALDRMLADTAISFDVVLMRITRSLAAVEAMAPGDLIPFDVGDLSMVRVEDGQGRAVFTGSLGQVGGKRAVRLGAGGSVRAQPLPEPIRDLPALARHPALAATLEAQAGDP